MSRVWLFKARGERRRSCGTVEAEGSLTHCDLSLEYFSCLGRIYFEGNFFGNPLLLTLSKAFQVFLTETIFALVFHWPRLYFINSRADRSRSNQHGQVWGWRRAASGRGRGCGRRPVCHGPGSGPASAGRPPSNLRARTTAGRVPRPPPSRLREGDGEAGAARSETASPPAKGGCPGSPVRSSRGDTRQRT